MKVVHVITALDTGGAQNFLLRLIKAMPSSIQTEVIALGTTEPMGGKISELGVPVRSAGMRPGLPDPFALARLVGMLRDTKPDIVHTWMYHADLFGGAAARLAGVKRVAWCIRIADLAASRPKRMTWLIAKLSAFLSRWIPDVIVCCADTAASSHVAIGYDRRRMQVILNGLDTQQFKPDPLARRDARYELALAEGHVAIGMVGRLHPQKNHAAFFAMAKQIVRDNPAARFVLVGPGLTAENPEVMSLVEQNGGHDVYRLAGDRRDIARIMNGLDVFASPSLAEGFPNAVAEAMSTGLACVATDVGDTRVVIGDAGKLVASGNQAEFIGAVAELSLLSPRARSALGIRARDHIVRNFDIEKAARAYENLYRRLIAAK